MWFSKDGDYSFCFKSQLVYQVIDVFAIFFNKHDKLPLPNLALLQKIKIIFFFLKTKIIFNFNVKLILKKKHLRESNYFRKPEKKNTINLMLTIRKPHLRKWFLKRYCHLVKEIMEWLILDLKGFGPKQNHHFDALEDLVVQKVSLGFKNSHNHNYGQFFLHRAWAKKFNSKVNSHLWSLHLALQNKFDIREFFFKI